MLKQPQHRNGSRSSAIVSQAIIGNYAVPILEEKQVWGTNDQTRTAYLDTTDVARMTLAALRCACAQAAQPSHGLSLPEALVTV